MWNSVGYGVLRELPKNTVDKKQIKREVCVYVCMCLHAHKKFIIIIKTYIALNKQYISLYRNWTCWRVPHDKELPLANRQHKMNPSVW